MSDTIITGYLSRKQLIDQLRTSAQRAASTPVEAGENQGYRLGHSLGYQDALKEVMQLIKELPDEPKPTQAPKPWHHGKG